MSRHSYESGDIISRELAEAMSLQADLCRNKDHATLKPEKKTLL